MYKSNRLKAKTNSAEIISNLILFIFAAFLIIPFLYIISISFSNEDVIAKEGYKLIPSKISLDAYRFLFKNPGTILNAYFVSALVTVTGTILSITVTSTFAYTMSRKDFKAGRIFSFLVFLCMLFNFGLVPWYLLITNVYKLKNTIFALIFPYVIIPWHVFLMRGFLQDIPDSFIESAKLDGASEITIFIKIIVPIAKSAIITVSLFTAFTYWNDWWLPMLFVEKVRLIPLQYMLQRIMTAITFVTSLSSGVNMDFNSLPSESARMAICIIVVVPMLLIFPMFQKYFIKGITLGAIKG